MEQNNRLDTITLYTENGDKETPIREINYLYMGSGKSSVKNAFTVAALNGQTTVWSDFEVFDTLKFSGDTVPEPFVKIDTIWENIIENGTMQAGAAYKKEADNSSLFINPGNIDLKKTRRVNPMKRKDQFEIFFKDGTLVQLKGRDLSNQVKSIFKGINERRYRNRYYLYIGKKAFHLMEIDKIKWDNAEYPDGRPYKSIKILLKNGKKVHSYSKHFEDFKIKKWMKIAGVPKFFFLPREGTEVRNKNSGKFVFNYEPRRRF